MQEMRLIDAVSAEAAIKDYFKKQINEEYLYLEVTDCNADILAILNALPSVPAVPLEAHEKMKRELNTEIEALTEKLKATIAGQETLQKAFAEKNAEVEKAKEKCIYFAKELQKARAETDRVTAIGAEWKEVAYIYADNIDRIKTEAIKEFAEKANEMITDIYNKHVFDYNDLNDEEKDAIINFSDDITSRFNNLVKERVGDTE